MIGSRCVRFRRSTSGPAVAWGRVVSGSPFAQFSQLWSHSHNVSTQSQPHSGCVWFVSLPLCDLLILLCHLIHHLPESNKQVSSSSLRATTREERIDFAATYIMNLRVCFEVLRILYKVIRSTLVTGNQF